MEIFLEKKTNLKIASQKNIEKNNLLIIKSIKKNSSLRLYISFCYFSSYKTRKKLKKPFVKIILK